MILAKISQASMLATWQDLGRTHSTHHGVGQGGVMDLHAACWANRLLGREISQPLIEITMGSFTCQFQTSCQIAITGADMNATLNGNAIQNWQTQWVSAGDELKFNNVKFGFRAYLAIDADITLDTIFNSSSTVIREQFPGLLGRALGVGDQILGKANESHKNLANKQVPDTFIPNYSEPLTLELIPSYQFYQFPKRSVDKLLHSEYYLKADSSRMAYLLKGEKVEHSIRSLASEGIAYGSVQVPPNGQPVILLNDRQTMGGYPKLGCISRLSGAALSQRFNPSSVRFKLISIEEANKKYTNLLRFFTNT